jgi:hypothetical protein
MSFDLIQGHDLRASPIFKSAHQLQTGQQIAHNDWRFADFADHLPADGACLFLLEPGDDTLLAKGMTTRSYHSFGQDAVADGACQLFLQKSRQVRESAGIESHLILHGSYQNW